MSIFCSGVGYIGRISGNELTVLDTTRYRIIWPDDEVGCHDMKSKNWNDLTMRCVRDVSCRMVQFSPSHIGVCFCGCGDNRRVHVV